nr:hypothetical protein GCM10025730_27900 [Promicromonospora thailandica]
MIDVAVRGRRRDHQARREEGRQQLAQRADALRPGRAPQPLDRRRDAHRRHGPAGAQHRDRDARDARLVLLGLPGDAGTPSLREHLAQPPGAVARACRAGAARARTARARTTSARTTSVRVGRARVPLQRRVIQVLRRQQRPAECRRRGGPPPSDRRPHADRALRFHLVEVDHLAPGEHAQVHQLVDLGAERRQGGVQQGGQVLLRQVGAAQGQRRGAQPVGAVGRLLGVAAVPQGGERAVQGRLADAHGLGERGQRRTLGAQAREGVEGEQRLVDAAERAGFHGAPHVACVPQ